MCRLYGFRANEQTKVECTLVYAQNALLTQSHADLRGTSHPDGWGIAYYDDGMPQVERRDTAAYADLHFSITAERMYAGTVLAHIRRATVGSTSAANTHPFVYGRWSFAHNGTVRGFEEVAPQLEREAHPELLACRQGSTDSELVFYWLLSRMAAGGVDLDAPGDRRRLEDAVRQAVVCLEQRSQTAHSEKPAQLNFVITDGAVLVACRWRNSLHWVQRLGVHDCEICGIPHVRHRTDLDYRAVVVASEPISHEPWERLPEGAIISVGRDARAAVQRI